MDIVSSRHEAKYYITALYVRSGMRASDCFACIEVATAKGNSETEAFGAITSQSVQKRELFHAIAQALFRHGRDIVDS